MLKDKNEKDFENCFKNWSFKLLPKKNYLILVLIQNKAYIMLSIECSLDTKKDKVRSDRK